MVTDANQTNCGEHFAIFTNTESSCYAPETVFYQLYLKKLMMQN